MSNEKEFEFNDIDMSQLSDLVEKAKDDLERSASGGFTGQYFWEWQSGENIMFICPPWKPKGFIFKKVGHFRNLPKEIVSKRHNCVEVTSPHLGLQCPIMNVIRKWEGKGYDMDEYYYSVRNYANVIDFKGEFEKWEVKSGDKVYQNEADFSVTPYIASFTEKTANTIITWLGNPLTVGFYNPNNAIPIDIHVEFQNNRPYRYNPTIMQSLGEDRKMKPMRVPMHQNAEGIAKILENLHDLDKKFDIDPVLLQPGGAIYDDAQKLDKYFEILFTAQASMTSAPGITSKDPNEEWIARGFSGKAEYDEMVKKVDITNPVNLQKLQMWMSQKGTKIDMMMSLGLMPEEPKPVVEEKPVQESPTVEEKPVAKSESPIEEKPVITSTTIAENGIVYNANGDPLKPKPINQLPDCYGYFNKPVGDLDCSKCAFAIICKAAQ